MDLVQEHIYFYKPFLFHSDNYRRDEGEATYFAIDRYLFNKRMRDCIRFLIFNKLQKMKVTPRKSLETA